jgi:hypothetical protein
MRYRTHHAMAPCFEVEQLEARLLMSGTAESLFAPTPLTQAQSAIIADAKLEPAQTVQRTTRPRATGDRLESNDTRATAADLGAIAGVNRWDRLSFHRGDRNDFVRFSWTGRATAQDVVIARSRTRVRTNLNLYLYDSEGQLVRRAASRRANEGISLRGLSGGEYTLRITSNTHNPRYQLITRTPIAIAEDAYEPNDQWYNAAHLGTVEGTLAITDLTMDNSDNEPDAIDWYTFDLAGDVDVDANVRIDFQHAQGDLDMSLYDSNGYYVDGAYSVGNQELISLAGQSAGRYILGVYGYAGSTNPGYTLTVTAPLASDAPDDAPQDPVPDTPGAGDPSSWTVLVYVAADNNLEAYGLDDINEMESANLPDWMRAGVLIDRTGGHSTANGNWTDTRVGEITSDNNTSIISSDLTSWGERNTGNTRTLIDFVEWGVAAMPADNYALVLWNHGGGIDGIAWDDTSGDHLSIAELDAAMDAVSADIDVLGFDACLMASAEVMHAVGDSVSYFVASQELEGGDGWDYRDLLNDLSAQGETMTARGFAHTAVDSARDDAAISTLSAIATATTDAFTTALRGFTDTALAIATSSDWAAMSDARDNADVFYDSAFRDLGDFLASITGAGMSDALATAAQAALTHYQDMIVNNYSTARESGTGLHVYMPTGNFRSFYAATDFNVATGWQSFVQELQASDARATSGTGRALDLWDAPALMTI